MLFFPYQSAVIAWYRMLFVPYQSVSSRGSSFCFFFNGHRVMLFLQQSVVKLCVSGFRLERLVNVLRRKIKGLGSSEDYAV